MGLDNINICLEINFVLCSLYLDRTKCLMIFSLKLDYLEGSEINAQMKCIKHMNSLINIMFSTFYGLFQVNVSFIEKEFEKLTGEQLVSLKVGQRSISAVITTDGNNSNFF